MLVVIINKPVDSLVHLHINTRIIQRCNAGQHNGRAVGLRSTASQEAVNILQENFHWNLFISIVTGKINTHQRNELNLRMLRQKLAQRIFILLLRFNYIQ